MSDYKAIKQTIRVFLVVEFCISPGKAGQKTFLMVFYHGMKDKCSLTPLKT